MANAQYVQQNVIVDGPIKYKLGNLYDANGKVLKEQDEVIAYIGSEQYFQVYERAHINYKTGAIMSLVGVCMFTSGSILPFKNKIMDGPITWGEFLHVTSIPPMIVGGIKLIKNKSRLKEVAEVYNYNYNYNQKSSLSFGQTSSGLGLSFVF